MSLLAPALTSDQAAILEAVRDFTDRVLAPGADAWDEAHELPLEILRQAGELGLGGIYASDERGGSGLTRADAVLIFEELARGDVTTAAWISIHNMATWMIDAFGTAEAADEWVPRLSTLGEIAAYAITEPGAGSDAAALRTTARRDGDDYVLNGVKQFISGAGVASAYVIMARTSDDRAKGITAFLVPADSPGLSFGQLEHKLGWRAQPTRQVILDDVRIPSRYVLGGEGGGFPIAMRGLNGGRLNMAACSLGGAQWAFEKAVQYVQEREAFGRPLAAIQTVVFSLADMQTKLSASRALLHGAASALDAGEDDAPAQCAIAKRFTTDAAFEVANTALQLHGGYGLLSDYGIERVMRDLRVHQVVEGTNEIMQLIVGRHVLDAVR
jgi:alkylation response protein AidB-like acyl-CoA dehydrogenase